jgi:hypothetical protein
MTATKKQTVRTVRLHEVPGSVPAVMMSRDGRYIASQYPSGLWQVDGPENFSTVAASKRAAKIAVRDHQAPVTKPRRKTAKK